MGAAEATGSAAVSVGLQAGAEVGGGATFDDGHLTMGIQGEVKLIAGVELDLEVDIDTGELLDETKDVIKKAVDLLPEKEKVVFLLRDVEGLSTEKVSEILDLTVPAVKSRLHRARLFLRKKLSGYFEEYRSKKGEA